MLDNLTCEDVLKINANIFIIIANMTIIELSPIHPNGKEFKIPAIPVLYYSWLAAYSYSRKGGIKTIKSITPENYPYWKLYKLSNTDPNHIQIVY
jgi:hypothetical protein